MLTSAQPWVKLPTIDLTDTTECFKHMALKKELSITVFVKLISYIRRHHMSQHSGILKARIHTHTHTRKTSSLTIKFISLSLSLSLYPPPWGVAANQWLAHSQQQSRSDWNIIYLYCCWHAHTRANHQLSPGSKQTQLKS